MSHLLDFYAVAFCVLRDLCLAPKLQRYFDIFSSISFIVLDVMFKFILNFSVWYVVGVRVHVFP